MFHNYGFIWFIIVITRKAISALFTKMEWGKSYIICIISLEIRERDKKIQLKILYHKSLKT